MYFSTSTARSAPVKPDDQLPVDNSYGDGEEDEFVNFADEWI
jgi:hypothetical protein